MSLVGIGPIGEPLFAVSEHLFRVAFRPKSPPYTSSLLFELLNTTYGGPGEGPAFSFTGRLELVHLILCWGDGLPQMCNQLLTGTASLQQLRESMTTVCVNTLYAYRKFCATTSSSGQLILPEALKLLPLYTLAAQKGVLLRSETAPDLRVRWASTFLSLSSAFIVPRVYPRMFAVHNLAQDSQDTRTGPLPTALALASEKLDPAGVYLCENGLQLFLWVGRQVSDELVRELFGVPDLASVMSSSTQVAQQGGVAVTEVRTCLIKLSFPKGIPEMK